MIEVIISGVILLAGLGFAFLPYIKKKKNTFENLDHIILSDKKWTLIKDIAWQKASTVLSAQGLEAKTKIKTIDIQKGQKFNPQTKQWGRKTLQDGKEFWYAGRTSTNVIEIVGTPSGAAYDRSQAIMSHEVGESILNLNDKWAKATTDERNKFLWSIGL